jgi:hypothetical protein
MSADYRADIEELARVRDDLAKWPKDRELAWLARYWGGFASWRIAINSANHQMKSEDLMKNLKNAATEFYWSIQLNNDFADSYAAAAGVNGWLAAFYTGANGDPASMWEHVSLTYALLSRATALDPHNPRVLWIKGGLLQFAPGGSLTRAIDVYKEMLDEARKHPADPASPLPDWGAPEALMSLAHAHAHLPAPDIAAAREEAQQALKIVPDWSYVRDNLLPQLQQQQGAK